MAYAIKYLFKFESSNGTTREIRVLKDGYTGEVIQRPLGRAPILKKQQNGPVHGTSLEFFAECNVDKEFIEFYTSDPKAYRVDLYAGATLLWQGYITPELYSEPDIAPPYDVQVVATDGVGELKLYNYAAQGAVSLRSLLTYLLGHTGLGTDVFMISSLKAGSRGAGALLDMTINLDYMAGKTCYETLTYILDTLHATITWWKGAWILTRETNVTFTNGKVRYFNTAGNSALLNDSVQVLGKMYANPAWPVGQLSTVIDPAKNRVTVQAPWHVVTCLRNSDMSSDANWTKAKNARYETDGYVLPVNINTGTSETAVISQATSMAGLRVPMSLSVKATGATSEISAQVTGAVLGVLLTYKVGNVTYHLVKGDDGVPVWQQGDDIGTYIPLRTRVDFQQPLATWDSSRIEAEELTIDNIPPFLQGTSFPAGTLTVYILGYCAKIYGAYLDVVLPKGYQDILRIDNGARGEGSEVEIAIGRETADNAYYAAFLQGLLLDTGNLITSFSDANFTSGMDYLAFIARDYALSVALPRAKVTGTVYLESGITAPPLVFTKGALNYWLQTWSWNLYDDELEIDALTLPSAQLTVLSEAVLEANGSTVSSSSGAGSAGGGSVSMTGGGANYFEPNTDLQTLIQLKSAYDYLGVRGGLFFTGGDTDTSLPDLYVDVIQDAGGNNVRVLRSPLPLITGGDQIVIDGTPGGGGGGGASNLYQLDDVSVSSRVSGDVLYYNGTTWVNKPASEIGGVTSVAGQTGAVTTEQIANALTTAGYKLTDTVITDYWKTGDSRTKNTVLAAPSSANGAASFRALVAADIPSLAISKITNLQTTLDGKQATISDLATIRSNAANGQSAYNALGNYVLKAGDTMTGDLIIEKTGGGLTIRGARLNANGDGGYIYLAARYFNHDRNGVKIASVYPGSGAYDIQDLVFYSSRNVDPNSDASPIWEESMRIKSTKAVIIAESLAIGTTLSVTGAATLSSTLVVTGATTLSSTLGVTGLATLTGGAVIPSAKTLKIGDATISWVANSGNGYLHIDKPLVTAGDQIVISGTPGGGGSGGASNLYQLEDVSVSSRANGDLLQYNGTKWVNVAASTVGRIYSAGTGISISTTNAIALTSAIQTNIANGQTAYGWGNHASAGYVLLATAQTITAKHTFSNGLILNTASSWPSSDRALYFAAHDDDTNLRYYYTDASKGLTFNPNTGALKAGSFVKRGGTSSQFLKANGSVDENVYLTGITSSMVTTALGYTPVPNTRTVNGKQLSANVTLSLDDIGNGTTRSLANYLPLAGGTMTGGITFANRTYLNWTSVDGSTNYNIFGVNNSDNLLIGYGLRTVSGSTTTLYGGDSVNLSVGGSTIASVASTGLGVTGAVTATGAGTFDTITLTNTGAVAHVNFSRVNWNYVNIPTGGTLAISVGGAASSNTAITVDAYRVKPGSNSTVDLGYVDASSASNNRLWANIYGEHFELVKTGGATLTLRGTTLNNQQHTILFRGSSSDSNGFKIETTAAGSHGRQSLGFYTSNVTSGSAPYTPVWKRALYIPYSGGVTIGTSSYNCNLTVYGAISSTGDQTVTSDALLKKNWRALRYGVKDIAGATAGVFDWKDGKGSSAGTKAQDWLRLVPELVHGEEGHMSLAYGQIAMLNTILIAREVVDHETRIAALERENRELREEIKRLRS